MLSRSAFALLVAGAAGSAVAQEATNKVNALYFHPIMTIVTASVDQLPLWLPLTYERELEGAKSLVLQTTLQVGSVKPEEETVYDNGYSYSYQPPPVDVFGLTLTGSFRNYFNGDASEGVYVAPALAFSYANASRDGNDYYKSEKASGVGVGVLGYLGYRAKWDGATLFVDLGLGRQWVSVSGDDDSEGISGSGLALDFNLGLGFPF